MTDLTFLASIPYAQDLGQEEHSSTQEQQAISRVIKLICQDIEKRRSELNRGKTIETFSIGTTWRKDFAICTPGGSFLKEGGEYILVNKFIWESAVRCFQLRGFKVRLSIGWWNPLTDSDSDIDWPLRRRRIFISVPKKNRIARLDDLTLMMGTVDHIFDKTLGAVGSQR